MKRRYTTFCIYLFILLAGAENVYSQSDFAPVGAVWYHNYLGGVYKTVVEDETTISGKKVSILKQSVYRDSFYEAVNYPAVSCRNLYLYSTTDTVFIYNERFEEFTPLYIFNVKAGDTVSLPIINTEGCDGFNKEDLEFIYKVDSVKYVLYDGQLLKTVYTKTINTPNNALHWAYRNDSNGVYVQKLGGLMYGFLPNCRAGCATITSANCNQPRGVRCYSEALISIKLISEDCDKGNKIKASIPDLKSISNALIIQPNPATDMVSIVNANIQSPSSLLVFNALGQIVLQQEYKAGNKITFDAGPFARGVYLVRLENKTNGSIATGKLIKE